MPPNTWKSTLDCWNGYHSVPLDPSSRHYTTFITPWGRLRYLVSLQGHNVSGDSFNWRYDQIIKDIKNCGKIVDDSILWSWQIKSHFFEVCNYLHITGSNGIIQNLSKFQFCKREIEYVGFTIMEDGIKPNEEMVNSIKNFPRPTNISGVRGWFGLTEQVAYSFSKSDVMLPFRHLLSEKNDFFWGD